MKAELTIISGYTSIGLYLDNIKEKPNPNF